jgi:hypothetical protein
MYRLLLHYEFEALVGLLIGVSLLALWKGGAAERIGGALNLAAGMFATFLHPQLSPQAQPTALLMVDAALAGGFLFLALRYASLWLGGALLLQAVQFSLHAYYIVMGNSHDFSREPYFMLINNLDTSGINVCILLGTVLAWRKRVVDRRLAPTG